MIKLYTDNDYNHPTSTGVADTYLHGCYFTGEAEEMLGHDLICVPGNFVAKEGVFDFEVIDSITKKQLLTGTLYMWKNPYTHEISRGLAVKNGDKKSLCYAIECYLSKKGIL